MLETVFNMRKRYFFIVLLLLTTLFQKSNAQRSSQNVVGVMVPQYMASGASNGRGVTYARLRIMNLMPNSSYKYIIRACSLQEMSSTSLTPGAGNGMYVKPNGKQYYITNPSFTTTEHDTITASMTGDYEGWFGIVGTGTGRFTAGNNLYLSITFLGIQSNDTLKYYCQDSLKVISYGTTSSTNSGTGIWGKSFGDTANFVALYDNTTGQGRPLTIAGIQGDAHIGATFVIPTTSNVPVWFRDSVFGKAGRWGSFIPNDLDSGVRSIIQLNSKTSLVVYNNFDKDGVWGPGSVNTKNVNGGISNPVKISQFEAPLIQPEIQFWKRNSTTNEGSGKVDIYVSRKYSNSEDQTVRLTVSGGTATGSGTDYSLTTPKTITFKPGYDGFDTTSITLVDDNISEGTESIFLKLDQPTNSKLGTETSHGIDILDNDDAYVSVKAREVKVNEGAGKVGIEIKIDRGVTTQSRIRLMVKSKGDSTLIPSEFSLSQTNNDTTFSFGKSTGPDSVTIFAKVGDDVKADPDDTINLVIRKVSGDGIIRDSLIRVVIIDNDGPSTIQMLGKSVNINESGKSVDVKVRVVSKKDAGGDFALRLYTAESSAKEGLDFTFNPTSQIKTITNTTPDTFVFNVPIKDDAIFEGNERIKFGLINVSNVIILQPDSFIVNILDDDLPIYSVGKINKQTKSDGTMDSSGVKCRIFGVVYGVNTRSAGLGFTVRDQTGGIGVFSPSKTFGYTVNEGDSVMIQGRVSQFQGSGQMDNLDTIVWLGSNSKLKSPVVLNAKIGEQHESDLIQLRRVKLVDALEWPETALSANGFKYVRVESTDGRIDTLNIDAETNIDGTTAPTGYFNVTGLGIQFDNKAPYFEKYYLAPRSLNDFTPASLPTIKFSKSVDEITELADSFTMELNILPTDENFSIDVVRIGGTAVSPTDFDYATRTISVKKNNNFYVVRANISDDAVYDGDKTIVFALRNLNGPGMIGKDSIIAVTIKDNEVNSVNSFAAAGMRCYPNPSNGQISIESKKMIEKLEVLDLSGRLVKQINTMIDCGTANNTLVYNLDLTGLNGVFVLSTQVDGKIYSQRVIIK